MDGTEDLWIAIRRVLPDAEESAEAVAAELGEPLDDVRLSVLIGTIALNGSWDRRLPRSQRWRRSWSGSSRSNTEASRQAPRSRVARRAFVPH